MRLVFVLGLCLALGSCKDKDQTKPADTSAPPATATASPPANKDIAPPVRTALAEYESIRKLLAADETNGIADAANKLATAATEAEKSATGDAKVQLGALARAAQALAAEKGDIDALRKAFGEVSKPLVALLASDPALRQGQHLFECPMAVGYKKWIQPSDKLENPYMGKKMLACGGPTDWRA